VIIRDIKRMSEGRIELDETALNNLRSDYKQHHSARGGKGQQGKQQKNQKKNRHQHNQHNQHSKNQKNNNQRRNFAK
ncbi:MAG: DUF4290 domain-containing protein, partial [Rikenellaceae bacterium]|nr:DUF4290 domain-containing protein [Rikenellaceae bacterium]